jgi:hypothetical protein
MCPMRFFSGQQSSLNTGNGIGRIKTAIEFARKCLGEVRDGREPSAHGRGQHARGTVGVKSNS